MSDERAHGFLQHILADPDDDAPRLIYADWLDEQGDSDRAEFIRVQIERAGMPKWDGRRVWLGLRENALIEKHGRKWKAELPRIKGVKWAEFRRGFVAEATFTSFAALRENAGACWAATPIEAISLRWPPRRESCEGIAPIAGLRELLIDGNVLVWREVEQLAHSPLLSTLRVLAIHDGSLGSDGLQRLMSSPHLGNLEALRLPGSSIGNAGIRALHDAASLTSLEELDLSETNTYGRYGEDPVLDRSGVETLAGWPGMKWLRSLNLSGHDVRAAGLRALLHSPHLAGLTELVLRNSGLTGRAMREFEAAQSGLQLDILALDWNVLEDSGAGYLARAKCLSELKVLELESCEMTAAGARRLAKAPFLATLRRLNADDNVFGPQGLQALLETNPAQLHTLLLGGDELGDEGARLLADSPASDTLLELRLRSCGLGDRAARALARSKHLQSLLILDLCQNQISKRARTSLRGSPLGKRLAVLEMTEPRRRR